MFPDAGALCRRVLWLYLWRDRSTVRNWGKAKGEHQKSPAKGALVSASFVKTYEEFVAVVGQSSSSIFAALFLLPRP
jgi:hypothetical protein